MPPCRVLDLGRFLTLALKPPGSPSRGFSFPRFLTPRNPLGGAGDIGTSGPLAQLPEAIRAGIVAMVWTARSKR